MSETLILPDWITPELLQDTIDVWSPHYSYTLTEDEAAAILADMGNLLDHFVEG